MTFATTATAQPRSLLAVYQLLLAQHGAQHWWPAQTPFEIMIGAVLVQNTAWRGVEKAVAALKLADVLTPDRILGLEIPELEQMIRPAGTFRVKARRLRALCVWLLAQSGQPQLLEGRLPEAWCAEKLRTSLLGVNGIGPETADDIMLYALGRPLFIADAYARRILHRLGFCDGQISYDSLQQMVHVALPGDSILLGEFHAVLVVHGRNICRPEPRCAECDLRATCRMGLRILGPRLSAI